MKVASFLKKSKLFILNRLVLTLGLKYGPRGDNRTLQQWGANLAC